MEYTSWIVPGVTPSLAGHFAELTHEEALEFTAELVRRIPERREQLEVLVRCTPEFASWVADYSLASLEPLGVWAKAHIPTRAPTKADGPLWRISPECPVPSEMLVMPEVPFLITDFGRSIVIDIGIYMAEIIRRSDPCWTWATCRDAGRGWVESTHHCPIISWIGRTKGGAFSPFFEGSACMNRILEGDKPTRQLREFVELKISMISMLREKYGATPLREPSVKTPRRPKAS